jgi:hypothetical protein
VALTAILVLAGCAGDKAGEDGSASGSSTSSATAAPTEPPTPESTEPPTPAPTDLPPLPTAGPPTAPPKSPSDPRPPRDVLVGRVTRGGSGPCFGMETDEGKQYALYTTATVTLETGDTIRVTYAPLLLKIDCGPGEPVSAVSITRVG